MLGREAGALKLALAAPWHVLGPPPLCPPCNPFTYLRALVPSSSSSSSSFESCFIVHTFSTFSERLQVRIGICCCCCIYLFFFLLDFVLFYLQKRIFIYMSVSVGGQVNFTTTRRGFKIINIFYNCCFFSIFIYLKKMQVCV